jgi:tetrahydromethanopterin S-methyltransferase F subunit
MTTNQRTSSGLPFITRPATTVIERIAFSVFRHWRWAGIVVSSMLTAGLMLLSIMLASGLQAEESIRSGTIGFLFAILLIAVPVWHVSRLELRAAPAWMIRAALATATDNERAFLFERLLQLATSEWRHDPITTGALFDLFKESRLGFGDRVKGKRERLMADRDKQVDLLRNLASIAIGDLP